jgi:hypothetical protein
MALVVFDRVKESSNTVGTGTVVLAGAQAGYQSFAVVGNNNTTYYTIAGQTTSDWEVGIGTYYTSNTSLARTTVLASSNANAAVSLLPGTKDVFITYTAEKSVYANNSPDSNYILTGNGTGVPPTWQALNAALATGNSSIVLNNTNITSNATVAAGQNGFSVGPINTANGVTVTIASGQTWTVI